MDDDNEEFEPLFDYSRIQPEDIISIDESCTSPIVFPKKRKTSDAEVKTKENVKETKVVTCNDEDEEDWLPPSPKNLGHSSKILEEDSTLKALRLQKQELASFAQSAEEVVRAAEESGRKDFISSLQSSPNSVSKLPMEAPKERQKLVITIQDKGGPKQFRVFKDDKFERLFKMYADKIKLDVRNLVFCFDGDKIVPTATPGSLEMEDEDIIEVHVKSH